MYPLIRPFLQLSMFALRPQDIPASRTLLILTLVCYGLVSVLLAIPLSGPGKGFAQSLTELFLLSGFTLVALRLRNYPERSVQTLTALAGCGALLSLMLLPFIYWLAPSQESRIPEEFLLLNLLIVIWLIAVYGHIFRHALSVNLVFGIVIALGYLLLVTSLLNRIFAP